MQSTRRRLLQALFGGSVLGLTGAIGGIAAKFLSPIAGEVSQTNAGLLSDLAAAGKIVKVGLKDVALLRTGDVVTALDLKCSHAGCTVHWMEGEHKFKCPCHGGEYSVDGKVVHGPPPRPLERLRVSIANGEVIVTDLPA